MYYNMYIYSDEIIPKKELYSKNENIPICQNLKAFSVKCE